MAVLAAVLMAAAWAGWHVLRGAQDLHAAAGLLSDARIVGTDADATRTGLRQAGARTSSARDHLSDPLVRSLAALPVVGDPLVTARGLAGAADTAVRDALLPLIERAGPDPAGRLTSGPGSVDVAFLSSLAPVARQAQSALTRAADLVAATPLRSRVRAVDRARAELDGELGRLREVLADASLALDLAPELLGSERTQRYLVLSQSPAEARGTGGLLGGYSLLEATGGAVRVVRSGSRSELADPAEPVVDLGVQFADHYGLNGPTEGWVNSNLSPHLPYAAEIWTALWERQFPAERLDGVVLLDPVALSYLLRATGPVALPDGSQVSTATVVDQTLKDVYARFPGLNLPDELRRNAYLQAISTGVAEALTTRPLDGPALVTALDEAVGERRLLLWSRDPAVQARLAPEPVSGTLPRARAVGDVIVDAAGSKLDYYLGRDLRYTAGCGASSRLALRLTNGAPGSGLPEYVSPPGFRKGGPAGTNVLLATLYLPPASAVSGVTLDGKDVTYRQGVELGLEWVEVLVTVLPGQSVELTAVFDEPDGGATPVERVAQPLVREETFTATGC